jgi:GMC oxidoreductase
LQVGQHLNDKPVVVTAYNFDPDFDLDGFITYVNIAAAVENNYGDGGGERRMLLTEPFSLGLPGAVDFLAFNRALFPSTLRDSNLAALVTEYLLLCDSSAGNTNPVCIPNIPFKEAGCTKQIAIVASYVGNISSEGSVSIGVNGTLEVDCNHLNSREDIEAFGAHARRGFDLVGALDGESAPEYPCDTKKNPTCALTTCPNLFKTLQDLILLGITLLYPKEAKQFQYEKEAEASVIFPNNIEQLVKQGLDDYELGKILRTNVVSSYHYAGTARFGSVIDSRFKVKGTDGLYVADSSALPKSTRVNAMATTVAIGRLAGISALREVWRPLHTQLQTSPADYET